MSNQDSAVMSNQDGDVKSGQTVMSNRDGDVEFRWGKSEKLKNLEGKFVISKKTGGKSANLS